MTEQTGSEPVLGTAVESPGADANTRDAAGRRFGGEKLGKHPTPLVWILVFVIFAGTAVAGVAIIFDSLALFIVGVAVTAVAGIASLAAGIMHMTE